ncbi:MAG: hypothetical protein FWH03_00070 [Firmicutes bacterium]|nr:hypothetical protein [Bacillota bacterium]
MKKITFKITALLVAAALSAALLTGCFAFLRPAVHSFPNLIDAPDAAPIRPIDSFEAMEFETTKTDGIESQLLELLEITMRNRRRPAITSENVRLDVKDAYYAALSVLNRYIKNAWHTAPDGDFQKVWAIHDYLAGVVEYDEDLYSSWLHDDTAVEPDHPSFHLTGVFLNGRAVCDGIAKAFVLLCAIEGIEARYVSGYYTRNNAYIPHAWNKVKIGNDWYNVDATMDNVPFYNTGSGVSQWNVLHHGYFLRSDEMLHLNGWHEEDHAIDQRMSWDIPVALGEYDFYGRHTFAGISDWPLTARDTSELREIFQMVRRSKNPRIGAIQVRLDFFTPHSEDLADYSNEIAEAYRSVPNANFSFSPGRSEPFMQYPGGIFVFMIYV